ncbi:MAG: tRNA (guanine(10)-N(2))-dimethyltransferase, partial [Methanocorpusculaceae archaeon]|nr:tRNA (guanine(10)-N(2))-dimethyltransferase [Methanocorpusculaceae archaeon]
KLQGEGIIDTMLENLPAMEFGTKKQMEKFLRILKDEPECGFFYDYHAICREIRVSPPKMEDFVVKLNEMGYVTARTHFHSTGIKTAASLAVLTEVLQNWE